MHNLLLVFLVYFSELPVCQIDFQNLFSYCCRVCLVTFSKLFHLVRVSVVKNQNKVSRLRKFAFKATPAIFFNFPAKKLRKIRAPKIRMHHF